MVNTCKARLCRSGRASRIRLEQQQGRLLLVCRCHSSASIFCMWVRSEKEAWVAFKQFDEMLKVNALTLTSLALSERFSWQLWLDNGVRLNLGRKDKAKRVQRFIDVYSRIEQRADARIDAIDLRYDTGLAVSYKPMQEQQL